MYATPSTSWPTIRGFLCLEWLRRPERFARNFLPVLQSLGPAVASLSPKRMAGIITGTVEPLFGEMQMLRGVAALILREERLELQVAHFNHEIATQRFAS